MTVIEELVGTIYVCVYVCNDFDIDSTPIYDTDEVHIDSTKQIITAYVGVDCGNDLGGRADLTLYVTKDAEVNCLFKWFFIDPLSVMIVYQLPYNCNLENFYLDGIDPETVARRDCWQNWSVSYGLWKYFYPNFPYVDQVVHLGVGEEWNPGSYGTFITSSFVGDIGLVPGTLLRLQNWIANLQSPTNSNYYVNYLGFSTRMIYSGRITEVLKESELGRNNVYLVNIMGHYVPVKANDDYIYDVGNWVFVIPKCCGVNVDDLTERYDYYEDCETPCDQPVEFESSDYTTEYPYAYASNVFDVPVEVPYAVYYDSDEMYEYFNKFRELGSISNPNFIIVPLDIEPLTNIYCTSGNKPAIWTYRNDHVGLKELMLACIQKATIIELKKDEEGNYTNYADIDVSGYGRVDGVPIKFHFDGEEGYENGWRAFSEDEDVFVYNGRGYEEPSNRDLVIFSKCCKDICLRCANFGIVKSISGDPEDDDLYMEVRYTVEMLFCHQEIVVPALDHMAYEVNDFVYLVVIDVNGDELYTEDTYNEIGELIGEAGDVKEEKYGDYGQCNCGTGNSGNLTAGCKAKKFAILNGLSQSDMEAIIEELI
jgi:hypothetical protein